MDGYKKYTLLIMLCLVSTNIFGITKIKYNYKNNFTITLPNTLELKYDDNIQSECLKETSGCVNINSTYYSDRIVWQQSGLNNPKSKDTFNKYCRIITIYTKVGEGEVPSKGETINVEENFWDEEFKGAKEECEKLNLKIINIIGFNIFSINSYPAYYICYLRTGWNGAPPVVVYQYTIYNGNKVCNVSFSYRQSEAKYWANLKNNIENSFYFVNSAKVTNDKIEENKSNATNDNEDNSWYITKVIAIIAFVLSVVSMIIIWKRKSKSLKTRKNEHI